MLPRNIDLTNQRLFQKEFKGKLVPLPHIRRPIKIPWRTIKPVASDECERCGKPLTNFPWNDTYRELCNRCEAELRKTPWFFNSQMSDNRDSIFGSVW